MAIRLPFNWSLEKTSKIIGLKKSLSQSKMMRHGYGDQNLYDGQGDVGKIPRHILNFLKIKDLWRSTDVLMIISNALRQEIFRNGMEWEPKFVRKCTNDTCETEYQHEQEVCEECGGLTRKPNQTEMRNQEEFFKKVNLNDQSLEDVMKSINDDLEMFNNAYLLLIKDYIYAEDGSVAGAKIGEIIKGDATRMRIVMDSDGIPGRNDSGPVLSCPQHREQIYYGTEKTICGTCDCKLMQVYYVADDRINKRVAYFKQEILHIKKYGSDIGYGFPQVLTTLSKIYGLNSMDRDIETYWQNGKPLKSMLLVRSNNHVSINKAWEEFNTIQEENPNKVFPFVIGADSNSKEGKFAEVIDFQKPLEEMQFIEVRAEYRKVIGMLWGVSPVFMGEGGGGVGREGLQVAVTNRAVELGQGVYNEKIFPWLLKQYGIQDWNLNLIPSERRDKVADMEVRRQMIEEAQMMAQLGYEPEMVTGGEFGFEFTFSPPEGLEQEGSQDVTEDPENDLSITPSKPSENLQGEPEEMGPSRVNQRFEGEPLLPKKSLKKNTSPYEMDLVEKAVIYVPAQGELTEMIWDAKEEISIANVRIEDDIGNLIIDLTSWKEGKTSLLPRRTVLDGENTIQEKWRLNGRIKVIVEGVEKATKVNLELR